MNDETSSLEEFDPNTLSEEDQAVLHAFEAMDSWPLERWRQSTDAAFPIANASASSHGDDDDMLHIFIEEVAEDIIHMQEALHQIELDRQTDALMHFTTLRRAGHKVRGTAGAIGFPQMATVAHHIEAISEKVTDGAVSPSSDLLQVLTSSVAKLEHLLVYIGTEGQEPEDQASQTSLETLYHHLNISLDSVHTQSDLHTAPLPALPNTPPLAKLDTNVDSQTEDTDASVLGAPSIPRQVLPQTLYSRIDAQRFEDLLLHTEQLIELRALLENTQERTESALQELHAAQARLQELEPLLSIFQRRNPTAASPETSSSSSLVTRILHEDKPRYANTHVSGHRALPQPAKTNAAALWDEMNIERYNEQDLLIRSLRDAISDITVTTALALAACQDHAAAQQSYLSHVAAVRNDALLMRQAPLSTLLPRLERVVKMSLIQNLALEAQGEETEIDQDILEALATPLVQLLRTSIAETAESTQESPRIWLHANAIGNDVLLELGFSMTIQGGAVESLRASIQRVGGKLALQRNTYGSINWLIRVPRSQHTLRCLLVQVRNQQLIVPFAQVQRISQMPADGLDVIYDLDILLFQYQPGTYSAQASPLARSLLIMYDELLQRTVGIAVDAVIDTVELVVKPLKTCLQRPGVVGTAIDGKGNVLLMVDLPALIQHTIQRSSTAVTQPLMIPATQMQSPHRLTVVVADDSAYLRRSVVQLLEYEGHTVIEAKDGIDALDMLQKHQPQLCLIDIEMPNLNGYDVLDEIRQHPEWAYIKIIMLTSRSSGMHIQHAKELGAHAYLTKPCNQETLLETIEQLLPS